MPRVHEVKKARRDYPEEGIRKGETYYYWKFRFGGLHRSKTYPKRSQLTQSGFLSTIYDIEDRLQALTTDDDLQSEVESAISELEEAQSEAESSLDNMPDNLRDSSMLNERLEAIENMISELQGIDFPDDDAEEEDIESCLESIQSISYEGD